MGFTVVLKSKGRYKGELDYIFHPQIRPFNLPELNFYKYPSLWEILDTVQKHTKYETLEMVKNRSNQLFDILS